MADPIDSPQPIVPGGSDSLGAIPQVTLPDVDVTPDEVPQPPPSAAGVLLAGGGAALDSMTGARAMGYSWPEIDQHLATAQDTAARAGYSQQEVDQHLGMPNFETRMQGLAHNIDPEMPTTGVTRPMAPGEYVSNPDGSWSNEVTTTTEVNGKPTVVPTLWLLGGEPHVLDEDQAAEMAERSGLKFPTFGTMNEANAFAAQREANWQNIHPGDKSVPPLWSGDVKLSYPDPKALVDYSLGIAQDTGATEPAKVAPVIRQNMYDMWKNSGANIRDIYNLTQTNPDFRDALTRAPNPPPPYELLTHEDLAPGVKDMGGGVVWMGTPPPKTPKQAAGEAVEMTGLPDIQKAIDAFRRDTAVFSPTTLEMIGHGGAGMGNAMSWFNPALKVGKDVGFAGVGLLGKVTGALYREHFMTPAEQAAWKLKQTTKALEATAIIKETGQARRDKALASDAIEHLRKVINPLMPAHKEYIKQVNAYAKEQAALKAAATGGGPSPINPLIPPLQLPKPDAIQTLIDHVEMRPGGGRLAPTSPLYDVADQLRVQYQQMRFMIENQFPDMASYVNDYYRHLWKRNPMFDALFGVGRQGSGASLNKRSIPTYFDGIMRGLEPKVLDPIDNMLHYYASMRDFIAAKRVIDRGIADKYLYYATKAADGTQDIPLKGQMAQRIRSWVDPKSGEARVMPERLYGSPGAAKIYNNWVGKGVYDWPSFQVGPIEVNPGAVYDKLLYASNSLLGLGLGLSGFHAVNIATEVGASSFANGLGALTGYGAKDATIGLAQVNKALQDIGLGAMVLPKVATQLRKGARLTDAYLLRGTDVTPMEERLARIFTDTGGRMMSRGQEMFLSGTKNLFTAWQQNGLGNVLAADFEHVLGSALETPAMRAALTPGRMLGAAAHEFGQVMHTLSSPLFDYAIPKVKAAAWADEMEGWLGTHLHALPEEIQAYGQQLHRLMDYRFGELVQDNYFGPRIVKQIANLTLVSVGWEYGTLAAFGGALQDLSHGSVFSTKMRWLMGVIAMSAIQSTAYQFMKTGTLIAAENLLRAAPLTGGSLPDGQPEEAQIPSPIKEITRAYSLLRNANSVTDVLALPFKYGAGKLNPAARMISDTAGAIWNGKSASDWLSSLVKEGGPIFLNQSSNAKRGTNLGYVDRWSGVTTQPRAVSDEANLQKQLEHGRAIEQWKEQYKAYKQDKDLAEPVGIPKPVYPAPPHYSTPKPSSPYQFDKATRHPRERR
jgi:hypothetical protein